MSSLEEVKAMLKKDQAKLNQTMSNKNTSVTHKSNTSQRKSKGNAYTRLVERHNERMKQKGEPLKMIWGPRARGTRRRNKSSKAKRKRNRKRTAKRNRKRKLT